MLSFKISLKIIKHRFSQSFTIFLTILIGIAIQFFILSIGEMLSSIVYKQTTSYQEHLRIQYKYYSPVNFEDDFNTELDAYLTNHPDFKYHLYSRGNSGGYIRSEKIPNIVPVSLMAIDSNDITDFQSFFGLNEENNLIRGRVSNPNLYELMVSENFSKRTSYDINDEVTYTNAFGLSKTYTIVGIYDDGNYSIVDNIIYTHYLVSPIINYWGTNKVIYVQMNDFSKIDSHIEMLNSLIPNNTFDVKITSIFDSHPEIKLINTAQTVIVTLIDIFISFGIFIIILGVLNHAVEEEYKHFGILKAIGLKDRNVYMIISFYIGVIGFIATTFGLIFGTLGMIGYHNIMRYPNGTPRFPLILPWYNYLIALTMVIITLLFVVLFTFRNIRKKKIIEIIKL